jgi:quinol monooxygenase YgiN
MHCQTAARRELQQALLAWEGAARMEQGVNNAHVYEDVMTPGVFCLVVQVASPEALEAHLHSPWFGTLLGALNVLAQDVDMSICEPAQEFGHDALGCIRRLRERPAPGSYS